MNIIHAEHLCFNDAPESFRWSVIDTVSYSGHGLGYVLQFKLILKDLACVLEAAIGME